MIDKLTKEQEDKIPSFVEKWRAIGLCTDRANRTRAEAALTWSYEQARLKAPTFEWYESPRAMHTSWKERVEKPRHLNFFGECIYGQHEAGWLAFYDFCGEVLGLQEEVAPLYGLFELAQSAGWAVPCEDVCLVSERNSAVSVDSRGRLHSARGPALAYPDGFKLWKIHGVTVPSDVITNPEAVTVKRINDEQNAEVRRVLLERFGEERYVKESGLKAEQRDSFGEVFRASLRNDEPLTLVRVVNSSPELDGSFKPYFLRVPPYIKTAREAVAWSFGMNEFEYEPEYET